MNSKSLFIPGFNHLINRIWHRRLMCTSIPHMQRLKSSSQRFCGCTEIVALIIGVGLVYKASLESALMISTLWTACLG